MLDVQELLVDFLVGQFDAERVRFAEHPARGDQEAEHLLLQRFVLLFALCLQLRFGRRFLALGRFRGGCFEVRDAGRVVRRVGHDLFCRPGAAGRGRRDAIQWLKASLVIDVRAVDLRRPRSPGMPPPHADEADEGKQNGAERRDETEMLGHDAGTLADQSFGFA